MRNRYHWHNLWLAPTLLVVSTQSTLAQVIDVINVQVNSTPQGLELILNGNIGSNRDINQSVEDNRLILTINNARLVGEVPLGGRSPATGWDRCRECDILRALSDVLRSVECGPPLLSLSANALLCVLLPRQQVREARSLSGRF